MYIFHALQNGQALRRVFGQLRVLLRVEQKQWKARHVEGFLLYPSLILLPPTCQ